MMRAIWVFFFVLVPSFGLTQPIAIQTGEHPTFTRVVLSIPVNAEWRLGRNETGYILRLPTQDGYDLSNFYDLIPRDRIESVVQNADDGELSLRTSCACSADAFLYRPDILVIDIRDGAPEAGSPFELALDKRSTDIRQIDQNNAEPYNIPSKRFLPLISSPVLGQLTEVAMPEPEPTIATEVTNTNGETSSLDDDLASLEQSIALSLARGLSQGILEPDLGTSDAVSSDNEALTLALGLDGALAPGLRARTSVDQAAIPEDPAVAVTQSGDTCLSGRHFDVGSWGDERPYAVQISEARAALTQEFDQINQQAVLDLARRFVFFGFGREANQTLEIDGVRSVERHHLATIARIVDDDPVEVGLFDQQVSCQSPVALWAMLAQKNGAQDAQVDRTSVLRAFKALPFDLQTHLGPRLADRFIAIGDMDGASQAIAVVRADPDPTIDATIAQTDLTRALGQPAEATEVLAELADTDIRMTPQAMAKYLTEAVKNSLPLNDDDFLLADALRFESAQLPVVGELSVAQVRAYIYLGEIVAASALIAEEAAEIGADRLFDLRNEIAIAAVTRLDPVDFLTFAFDDEVGPISYGTENRVARRLLDLGFPDAAQTLIIDIIDGEPEEARRYLRAEASLAMNDVERATAALDGLTTDRANALRRVIDDTLADNVLIPDMSAAEVSETNQWRRGDWNDLGQSEDPVLQAVSAAVLEQEVAELDTSTPLASGRALLNRSAQSRGLLDDLLNRFTAPEDL